MLLQPPVIVKNQPKTTCSGSFAHRHLSNKLDAISALDNQDREAHHGIV